MMAGLSARGLTGRSTFELFVRNAARRPGFLVGGGSGAGARAAREPALHERRDSAICAPCPRWRPRLSRSSTTCCRPSASPARSGPWLKARCLRAQPLLRVTAPLARGAAGGDGAARHDHVPDEHREQDRPHRAGGAGTRRRGVREPARARPRRRAARGAGVVYRRLPRDVERRGGLSLRHPAVGHDGALVGDVVRARDRRLPRVPRPLRRRHHAAHRHLRHGCRRAGDCCDGLRPGTVRLDSGDLVALSREVRRVLDAGGLTDTRIIVSRRSRRVPDRAAVADGAPIDAFGVGTALSTSRRRAGARRRLQARRDRAATAHGAGR